MNINRAINKIYILHILYICINIDIKYINMNFNIYMKPIR